MVTHAKMPRGTRHNLAVRALEMMRAGMTSTDALDNAIAGKPHTEADREAIEAELGRLVEQEPKAPVAATDDNPNPPPFGVKHEPILPIASSEPVAIVAGDPFPFTVEGAGICGTIYHGAAGPCLRKSRDEDGAVATLQEGDQIQVGDELYEVSVLDRAHGGGLLVADVHREGRRAWITSDPGSWGVVCFPVAVTRPPEVAERNAAVERVACGAARTRAKGQRRNTTERLADAIEDYKSARDEVRRFALNMLADRFAGDARTVAHARMLRTAVASNLLDDAVDWAERGAALVNASTPAADALSELLIITLRTHVGDDCYQIADMIGRVAS